MNAGIATIWALAWLVISVALVLAAGRLGRRRSAAWLVVIGLFLVVIEEPALTVWLGIARVGGDPDAMAGLVTPMARAHVIDAGIFGLAAAVLLGWLALTAFRRGEPWATRVLVWSFVLVALAEVTTTALVFSRGLALSNVPGQGAYGWQPVAVALVAWAAGLWLSRKSASRSRVPVGQRTQEFPVSPRSRRSGPR